jgi:integrase
LRKIETVSGRGATPLVKPKPTAKNEDPEEDQPRSPRKAPGRIYQQKGSPYLWIAYCVRGREIRESSKSTDPKVAERLIRRRLDEKGADRIRARRFAGPRAERVTVNELLEKLRKDKVRRGRKDPKSEVGILSKQWGERLALDLTGEDIADWQDALLDVGYRPASINRLGQVLGQAYRLACEGRQPLLPSAPIIKRLSEIDNVRTGVFSPEEFERLLEELPDYLRDFARWARVTGWRAGSIRSLRWAEVDTDSILCRAQYSKDRTIHRIPLIGPLREIIERRRAERRGDYVFSYADGRPIGDFKNAWKGALKRAGLSGKLFHDLRRVAATELRRSGVPEEVAMKITGHRTRAMFSRYQIVDLGDVSRAIEQREAYRARQLSEQPVASQHVQ